MIERWRHLITDDEYEGLERAGYIARGSVSWGRPELGSRPALLVIDFQVNTVGPRTALSEAVSESPIASGKAAVDALAAAVDVLATARAAEIPIIFTRIVPRGQDGRDPRYALVAEREPRHSEVVIDKQYASAFAGTPLQSELTYRGVDSTIIVGITSSGCVRATVHGHEKVPACGQVEVLAGGQMKVLTPRVSCPG